MVRCDKLGKNEVVNMKVFSSGFIIFVEKGRAYFMQTHAEGPFTIIIHSWCYYGANFKIADINIYFISHIFLRLRFSSIYLEIPFGLYEKDGFNLKAELTNRRKLSYWHKYVI